MTTAACAWDAVVAVDPPIKPLYRHGGARAAATLSADVMGSLLKAGGQVNVIATHLERPSLMHLSRMTRGRTTSQVHYECLSEGLLTATPPEPDPRSAAVRQLKRIIAPLIRWPYTYLGEDSSGLELAKRVYTMLPLLGRTSVATVAVSHLRSCAQVADACLILGQPLERYLSPAERRDWWQSVFEFVAQLGVPAFYKSYHFERSTERLGLAKKCSS